MAFEQYSLGDAVCATMHTAYPQIVTQDRKRDGMLIVQCQGCMRRYQIAKATVVKGASLKLPFNHGVMTVNVARELSPEQLKAAETVCKIEGHDLGAPAPKGYCNRCGKQVDYDILSGLEKARIAAEHEAAQGENVGLGPLNSDINERLVEAQQVKRISEATGIPVKALTEVYGPKVEERAMEQVTQEADKFASDVVFAAMQKVAEDTMAVATGTLKLDKANTPPEILTAIKEGKPINVDVDFEKNRAVIVGVGETIKEGPWKGFEVISTYSSNEAAKDGILFDLEKLNNLTVIRGDKKQVVFNLKLPLRYITTGLLEKGYWNDRCKNAVPVEEAGKNDRCADCDEWKKVSLPAIAFDKEVQKLLPQGAPDKLDCVTRTINVPNLIDLITQALKIFQKKPSDDTFVSGRIELPDGSKQEIYIALNETGKYTVMLPEDN
jgi:hypothetical protein